MALQKYAEHQLQTGHTDLVICRTGFVVYVGHPFIGLSPDAYVFDPLSVYQFGLAEINAHVNTVTSLLWMHLNIHISVTS